MKTIAAMTSALLVVAMLLIAFATALFATSGVGQAGGEDVIVNVLVPTLS